MKKSIAMFRKIFYYFFMTVGIFIIVTPFVTYLWFGGEIENSFIMALAGLIPIFIALSNKYPLK